VPVFVTLGYDDTISCTGCDAKFIDSGMLDTHVLDHLEDDAVHVREGSSLSDLPHQLQDIRSAALLAREKRADFLSRLSDLTGFPPDDVVEILANLLQEVTPYGYLRS
jgi:hypothetical protein